MKLLCEKAIPKGCKTVAGGVNPRKTGFLSLLSPKGATQKNAFLQKKGCCFHPNTIILQPFTFFINPNEANVPYCHAGPRSAVRTVLPQYFFYKRTQFLLNPLPLRHLSSCISHYTFKTNPTEARRNVTPDPEPGASDGISDNDRTSEETGLQKDTIKVYRWTKNLPRQWELTVLTGGRRVLTFSGGRNGH